MRPSSTQATAGWQVLAKTLVPAGCVEARVLARSRWPIRQPRGLPFMVMTERDIRDILRGRPITVPQVFVERDRIHLLCPPGTNVATFESAKIAFGPFTASVLAGMALVSIPARLEEAQDLWSLIMRDAMPGEEQRRPGGEPLRTISSRHPGLAAARATRGVDRGSRRGRYGRLPVAGGWAAARLSVPSRVEPSQLPDAGG